MEVVRVLAIFSVATVLIIATIKLASLINRKASPDSKALSFLNNYLADGGSSGGSLFGVFFLILGAFLFGAIVLENFLFDGSISSELADPMSRFAVCVAFLVLGVLYLIATMKLPWAKIIAGVVKVGAATVSNYLQLEKYSIDPKGPQTLDRWVFIAGGVLVLSSGMKDIYEGVSRKNSPSAPNAAP